MSQQHHFITGLPLQVEAPHEFAAGGGHQPPEQDSDEAWYEAHEFDADDYADLGSGQVPLPSDEDLYGAKGSRWRRREILARRQQTPQPHRTLTDRYMEPVPEPDHRQRCAATVTPRSRGPYCELTRGHDGLHAGRTKRGLWQLYDGDPATPTFTKQPKCPTERCQADANTDHIRGCPLSRFRR